MLLKKGVKKLNALLLRRGWNEWRSHVAANLTEARGIRRAVKVGGLYKLNAVVTHSLKQPLEPVK
jgi:hypothetical protein